MADSDPLQLQLVVPQPLAVAGATLLADAILINTGGGPASIPSLRESSTFSYDFVSPAGRHPVSYRQYGNRLAGRINPPLEAKPPDVLAPGQKTRRREDLALWNGEPFAPGVYQVTARIEIEGRRLVSNEVTVQVIAPDFEFYSSRISLVDRVLVTAAAHRDLDGTLVLMQRESEKAMPGSGVFRPRRRLANTAIVSSVVTSVLVKEQSGGYWMAWLADGAIGALKGWSIQLEAETKPVDLKMDHVRLLEPGFVLEDGSGAFFVSGLKGGEAVVRLYHADRNGLSLAWETPLGAALPEVLFPQRLAGNPGTWQFVWLEGRTAVRILRSSRDASGGLIERVSVVEAEFSGPVLAAEAEAVARTEPGRLDVLTGPNGDGHLEYRRIVLGAGAPASPSMLQMPEPMAGLWSISTAREEALPVLAASEAGIQVGWTGSKVWSPVAQGIGGISHARIHYSGDFKFYCEWVDAEFGSRIEILPLPR